MEIIFEDTALIVLNKPSGITVNRSDTTREEETVQDWVEKRFGIQYSGFKFAPKKEGEWESPEEAFVKRAGIAHRLDKETSGILLVAKTIPAFIELQRQFKERIVKKAYLALAHGRLLPTEGEVSVPVGRLEFNRKRFGVVAGGKESKTKYKVLESFINPKTKEPLSLVELYPETGRTHQIRVHLKHLNRPIFADALYAGRKTARDDRKQLDRLFLHAARIDFVHPLSQERITFTSQLGEDLEIFLQTLQKIAA